MGVCLDGEHKLVELARPGGSNCIPQFGVSNEERDERPEEEKREKGKGKRLL